MLQREETDTANPFLPDAAPMPDVLNLIQQSERVISEDNTRESDRSAADPNLPVSAGDDEPEQEGACQWNQCCPEWSGPVMKIIDGPATEAAYKARNPRPSPLPSNDERRMTNIMSVLRDRGEYRKLQRISVDWRVQLTAFESLFPNFSEVIDYVRVIYALAEQLDGVPQLAPIMLNGLPGSGKSYFAEQFAKWFGSGYVLTHLETAQNNAGLSGSSDYWSNSKSGDVFNALVEGDFGNPVVCLDEIEKALACDYDPLSSLYSLLEPGTSRAFRDLSYPWLPPLDASRIIWIATSNDCDALPPPILSRFRRFEIDLPLERHARDLVRRLYRDLLREHSGPVANILLTKGAVDVLMDYSPRQVKLLLREALGRAVYSKRKRILARDIPQDQSNTIEINRSIGFL